MNMYLMGRLKLGCFRMSLCHYNQTYEKTIHHKNILTGPYKGNMTNANMNYTGSEQRLTGKHYAFKELWSNIVNNQ